MSIVVARSIGNSVVLGGDMRATDPHGMRRGYPYGVLKVVVIASRVCVAYTGDIEHGLDGVRVAAGHGHGPPDALLAALSRHITTSRRQSKADFLVAFTQPARIVRLTGHLVEDDLPAAWIGDYEAFEEFQRVFGTASFPFPNQMDPRVVLTGRVGHAMGELVREGRIATVGEAHVTVTTNDDGDFEYMTSSIVYFPTQILPAGVATPLRLGTAAEGAHAYAVLTPTAPGVGVVGLYFLQGRLGLLYHPVSRRDAYPYAGVTSDEFRRAVLGDHGIEIHGIGLG